MADTIDQTEGEISMHGPLPENNTDKSFEYLQFENYSSISPENNVCFKDLSEPKLHENASKFQGNSITEKLTEQDDSSSLTYVSAGQIRARCSSAKSNSNSSHAKDFMKEGTDESNVDKETLNNGLRIMQKPVIFKNYLKKSPGLALRLSENPICNHELMNGSFNEACRNVRETSEELTSNKSADSCEDVCSEMELVAEGYKHLSNYESRLINKEREEKLEKIARIDLLYQKQIESEMNAGIKAHLSTSVAEEGEVKPTSSHMESFRPLARAKKPNFLLDPSLGPKRKSAKPVFSRFPGKSVNLPLVEDGLSSGNASGDDDDKSDYPVGDVDSKSDVLFPGRASFLPPTQASENVSQQEQAESLEDNDEESSETFFEKVEDILEKLNSQLFDAKEVETECGKSSEDKRISPESSSVDSIAADDKSTGDGDSFSGPRIPKEHKDFKEAPSKEMTDEKEEVQSQDACFDAGEEMVEREAIRVDSDDSGGCDEIMAEPKVSAAEISKDDVDTFEQDFYPSIHLEAVSQDLPTSGKTSLPIVPSVNTCFSPSSSGSTAPAMSTLGTDSDKPEILSEPDPVVDHHLEPDTSQEFPANIDVGSEIKEKEEALAEVPKYPKVPLPHIRTGSSTSSPPISLDLSQISRPSQSFQEEVFELRPILGIPQKVPQVHRSPSPGSGKFHPSNPERIPSDQNAGPRGNNSEQKKPNVAPSRSSGREFDSSDDVENAIRDIKSAIMKSKNIKLSLPQQMDGILGGGQTEPIWITRQPQDLGRAYSRGALPHQSSASSSSSSAMMIGKNYQGRQELNCNAKSTLSSEEEGEKFSKPDDIYTTKGSPGFPASACYPPTSGISQFHRADEMLGHVTKLECQQNHPVTRPIPVLHPNPFRAPADSFCNTPWHEPYRCDRYDCHECRHLPDVFDDGTHAEEEREEEEDDEDEDYHAMEGRVYVTEYTLEEDEEEEEEDEDDDVRARGDLDVATPRPVPGDCRYHGNLQQRREVEVAVPLGGHPAFSSDRGGRGGRGGGGVGNLPKCKSPDSLGNVRNGEANPEYSTDEETDNLLKKQYDQEAEEASKHQDTLPAKQNKIEQRRNRAREVALPDPSNKSVLIEGVLFRANYLGSTQLVSEGQPSKAMRMMQAQEAVGRIKAPDGENQPSTEVDLFVSVEKIMVLNTDLQEIMMDHALRTISYIADIGDILVIMARRGSIVKNSDTTGPRRTQTKICCHVFESEEAQLIAQSIGQAFQVSYVEFLKANGIEETPNVKNIDYQDVLNQQEVYGEELYMLSNKEMQREVIISKVKGEALGVVIVESGWGSMIPTVVLANMSPCGAAARCNQLNIGDQIISINGISMVGLPLTTCQSYIKAAKSQSVVKLTVVSCPPVVEVLIKRPDIKYQLGFSVQNGVICSLLRGGIAERGGVRVGHRIIEINGQSVVAIHHEKIVNMLATSAGEIHMKTMPTSIFQLLTGQITPHYI